MQDQYDAVIVGGGIAGSGLATVLARGGRSVLVLEKTVAFPDVVRGEWLAPWGVLEAKRAGLYAALTCVSSHHIRYHVGYGEGIDPAHAEAHRLDMAALLPGAPGPLAIGHPQACQALHEAAIASGAYSARGATEIVVEGGISPAVAYTCEGRRRTARARIVIGADGRESSVRRQAGIKLNEDATHHLMAGMLVAGAHGWPEDVQAVGTESDVQYFVFPQGGGRARLYLNYSLAQRNRFAGAGGDHRLLEAFALGSVPASGAIAEATIAGPCRSFPNRSTSTDSPVAAGVVLIGDAAGYNDPIIGQGLSIAMRDVRTVGDLLLANDPWTTGLFEPYVQERAERMRRLRFSAALSAVIEAEFGPEARARRLRFHARTAADPGFAPARVVPFIGPEVLPAAAFSDEAWEQAVNP